MSTWLDWDDQTTVGTDEQPTWCHWCHLRIAPFEERVKFRGKSFHIDITRHCFTKWRLTELKKQADRRKGGK